ncbi:MAG TPA: cytochrome P450 [Streptosporangiaceae bacterium]|nr:cytochrome P450 [Streptosporangiaceae bacterium]
MTTAVAVGALAAARAAAGRLLAPPGPEDPYPDYAILRAHAPVLAAGPQVWLVSGYAEARDILADPAFGVQDAAWYDANRPQWRQGAASWTLYQGVQSRNPPDHTRMRRVLGRCFTARRMALLRDRVAALTRQFLDEVAAKGDGDTPVDLMSALAFPLPVTVINDLLGVPEGDRAEVHGLAGRVFNLTELIVSDEDRRSADAAAVTFRRYWRELVADRRRAPGPPGSGLTAQLIAAADAGELSDEELLSSLIFLHGAGYGTTAALLGNATVALLADPALAARLRADPGLAPAVVDESLRHEAPTQLTPRLARRPAQVGGTQVPEGHLAVLLLGAANRDPDRFPEPGRFDVDRQDNRPLSFGGGIHYCLGAPLSRMEATIVLPELVRRFPKLRLAGIPRWRRALRMRQLSSLPVRVG